MEQDVLEGEFSPALPPAGGCAVERGEAESGTEETPPVEDKKNASKRRSLQRNVSAASPAPKRSATVDADANSSTELPPPGSVVGGGCSPGRGSQDSTTAGGGGGGGGGGAPDADGPCAGRKPRCVPKIDPASMSINSDHYVKLQAAYLAILDLDIMADIICTPPLTINEGGHVEPFHPDVFKTKMTAILARREELKAQGLSQQEQRRMEDLSGGYISGANLLWLNPFASPTPGVPLSARSLKEVTAQYFARPVDRFPGTVRVAVVNTTEWDPTKRGWMLTISPEEKMHALLLRIYEDIQNQDMAVMEVWKRCLLSAVFEFFPVKNSNQIWLKAANNREKLGHEFSAKYRTGPQRAFELAAFKAKREQALKQSLSVTAVFKEYDNEVDFSDMAFRPGEKFTHTFVDTALTVYNRILSDKASRDLILLAEGEFGQHSPYNSLYRLELFAKKVC